MNILQKTLAWAGAVVTITFLVPTESDDSKNPLPKIQKIEAIQTIQKNMAVPLPEPQIEPEIQAKVNIPQEVKTVEPQPIKNITSECHPSYGGCLKKNAGDYDCRGGSGNGPNYTGMVKVVGYDEFGLDRDKDGRGCE